MNTFERELRKAVSAAGREDRARYVGRAAYLELDSGLHAKLQFVTQGIADRYGALQLSAISRTRGEIDRVTVRFEDVWGGQAPYLWRCDGKTEWYGAVPTPGDMELLARQIETFCALYEQDPRQGIYGKLAGFFSEFFEMMNMMGAELFDLPWTQAVVLFFSRFAWVLYAVGLVVAGFEYAIQSQSGRGDLHGLALNGIKGFMAVSLFTTVPVELYRLCVTLQGTFASGLTQLMGGEDGSIGSLTRAAMGALNGYGAFVGLFLLILLGYAVFKVFFANLRRGGILLIQIAVGSLYFFSVPRGYLDGFWNWGKQVAGLCLTAFLQTTMLVAGLMVWNTNMLLGCGMMLASTEVPRIAGAFGVDTSTRANVMGAVHTAQSVINTVRMVSSASG